MDLSPEQIRLLHTFFPYAFARVAEAERDGLRLVHYTSADAAVNILKSKRMWMRAGPCMNDYAEVQYGLECLFKAYRGAGGAAFKAALQNLFDADFLREVEKLFDGWRSRMEFRTYVSCFSEHDPREDQNGRVSMWQTYGESGVGIVINMRAFFQNTTALGAYSSPVAYLTPEEFEQQLGIVAAEINANADLVRSRGREEVKTMVFNALRFGAICNKHPGFNQEREWRVVHTPGVDEPGLLTMDVEVVKGVPQPIYKIPLDAPPSAGLVGMTIPELLDRIIIGPRVPATAVWDAFVHLLEKAGVSDPQKRVSVSQTPLR